MDDTSCEQTWIEGFFIEAFSSLEEVGNSFYLFLYTRLLFSSIYRLSGIIINNNNNNVYKRIKRKMDMLKIFMG